MQRQRFVLSFISCVAIVVTLFYSFEAMVARDYLLQGILLVFAAAFLGNLFILRLTRKLDLCCSIASGLIGCLILGFVSYGSLDSAALYWIFPFPVVLFGLLGTQRGLLAALIVAVCLTVVFFWPGLTLESYPLNHRTHALMVLFVVIVIGWLHEYGRERSHDSMVRLQRSKEAQVNTDALTRLLNRHYIDQRLPRKLRQRQENFFPLAVIACDLDHFKRVNDEYGHDVGDQVLKHAARLLKRHLRREDMACRVGGEEFLLLLPLCGEEPAQRVAEALRGTLERHPFRVRETEQKLTVTASFGVSVCQNLEALTAAFKQADQALYAAKKAGRNRVAPSGYDLALASPRP